MCCVGTGLCNKLITRSEESYQVCVCVCVCVCVRVCVCSRNLKHEAPRTKMDCSATERNSSHLGSDSDQHSD